jgi:hypothetical protein
MKIWWDIPISDLKREWLMDEHRTHHCLWGLYKRNLAKNPDFKWMGLSLEDIKKRHDLVVKEMIKRGYNHNYKSEIDQGCEVSSKKSV